MCKITRGGWSEETVKIYSEAQPPSGTDDFDVTARGESVDIDVLNRTADIPIFFSIDKLSVEIDSPASHGAVSVIEAATPDGPTNMVRYSPNAGFVGRDTFTYTIADIFGNRSEPATVTVDVYERAIAHDDLFTTPAGENLQFDLSELIENDVMPLNYQAAVRLTGGEVIAPTSQGGTITFDGNVFAYVPPVAGFSGVDSFEYVLYDSDLTQPPLRPMADSNVALVEIVSGPIAIEGFVYVDENQNGQRDSGEHNIADSIITLTSPDDPTLRRVTTSDSEGLYRFMSDAAGPLVAGSYTITQTQPHVYLDFLPNAVNQHANVVFNFGDDSSNRGHFNFREWLISPSFVTTIADYGAGFADSNRSLDLRNGSLVVPYDAGWDGPFVAQANYLDADGRVEISLYDSQGNRLTTDTSGDGDGFSRIDRTATLGQPLVLVVSGDNSAVSVELPNLHQFTSNDSSLPVIVDVSLSSSEWAAAVIDHLNTSGLGTEGFSVWNNVPAPWINVDQIKVRFSEDVDVGLEDLGLWGLSITDYVDAGQIAGFAYDPNAYTATWTLAESFGADRLRISIDGSVADRLGNPLRNENFHTYADVHPGADGFRPILVRNRAVVGDSRYSVRNDLDGDGQITIFDAFAARRRSLIDLPQGNPGPAADAMQAPFALIQGVDATAQDGVVDSSHLSAAGVDVVIGTVALGRRRLFAERARRSNSPIESRDAAVDSILSQSQNHARRGITTGRGIRRAHRSNTLLRFDADEAGRSTSFVMARPSSP